MTEPHDLAEDWIDLKGQTQALAEKQELGGIPTELTEDWATLCPHTIPRMTDEDLVQFVLGVCDNSIFTLHHLNDHEKEHMTSRVFLPVALGAFSAWFPTDFANIGTIWEYYKKALPRSINGLPMFLSCHVMHKDDWIKANRAIAKEMERRKAATTILDDLKEPT